MKKFPAASDVLGLPPVDRAVWLIISRWNGLNVRCFISSRVLIAMGGVFETDYGASVSDWLVWGLISRPEEIDEILSTVGLSKESLTMDEWMVAFRRAAKAIPLGSRLDPGVAFEIDQEAARKVRDKREGKKG